jgi:prephenate dehydrogenase
MPIKTTLLGLGRIGGSLALRFNSNPDLSLNGYDGEPDVAQQAVRQGRLKRADWSLRRAVADADLVLAALPYGELPNVLRAVAPDLRPGVVVATFGPLLGPPLAWAERIFGPPVAPSSPASRGGDGGQGNEGGQVHFIACHPILNPAHLHTGEVGHAAARADLFEGGLWALAPSASCPPEALKLLADLAQLAGAAPYHVDPAEHDGLAAASDGLPVLFACALLRTAAASPGWDETRKTGDRALATATAALAEVDPAALALNRASLIRYLDLALDEMTALRQHLAASSDEQPSAALLRALDEAFLLRNAWLYDRRERNWDHVEAPGAFLPSTGETMREMLLGRWGRTRK